MMDLYQEMWKSKKEMGKRFCQCGSCKAHWEGFVGMELKEQDCSARGCTNSAKVGGHIVSENYPEGYIVPLCDSCNQSDKTFEVKPNTLFVSADLSVTCEEEQGEAVSIVQPFSDEHNF